MRSARQTYRRIIYLIVDLLVILVLSVNTVNARTEKKATIERIYLLTQATEAECSDINVIMLIDQSNSMKINDPLELRYSAPVDMANKLAIGYQQALSNLGEDEKPITIKLSVVWFASTAKIMQDWIDINPADSNQKDILLQALRTKLTLGEGEREELEEEIGTHTNFINAFQKAQVLVDALEAQVNGCPEKVVLLITDGGPDTTDNDAIPGDYGWHFNQVKRIVNNTFDGPGNSIYITGINNTSEEWSIYNGYWKTIVAGESINEGDPAATENVLTKPGVGERLDRIIEKAIGGFVVKVYPGPYIVPPYVERLVFTFFKSEKTDVLIFTDPSGNPMEPGRNDVKIIKSGENEGIQSLEIYRPAPGIYTLGTTARSSDYSITAKTIFISARLTAPAGAVQQLATTPIQIDLVDSDGNPLPNYGDAYKLQVNAEIIGPKDYKGQLTMLHQMEASQITASFTPVWDGIYRMGVSATVNDAEGKAVEILNPDKVAYDLLVEPVKLEIGEIENSRIDCPITQYTPVTIPFRLVNAATSEAVKVDTITWAVNGWSGDILAIENAETDGTYRIRGIPSQTGDWLVNLNGSVIDLLDQVTLYDIFQGSITTSVMPGVQVNYNLDALGVQPIGFHLKVEQFLAKIMGIDPTIPMVIHRTVVFNQAPINILALLSDRNTGGLINQVDLLPTPVLVREEGEEEEGKKTAVVQETWRPDPDGSGFVFTLRANRGGVYQLQMDEAHVECGTVLVLQPYPNQVLLVPDLLTRILTLVGILIGLALIILAIILLVCRFVNPQYHHVDIDDASFSPMPGHQWIMSDTSCWRQKENGTPDVGGIYLIKISSVFSRRGEFTITTYYYDVQGKKQKIIKTRCSDGERIPVNMVSVYVYLNR